MNELIRREIRKEGLDATVKCIVEMYGEYGLIKALGACKVRQSGFVGKVEEHQFFFDLSKEPVQRHVPEYKPPLNFASPGSTLIIQTQGLPGAQHFTFEALIQ